MWSTGTAGSIASGAGISLDIMKAAGVAITYSSVGESGLVRLKDCTERREKTENRRRNLIL